VSADHDDLIREAEEKLAEANAEVARLREQLATEQKAEKVRLTAEDGRAEARRRTAQRAGRTEKVEKDAQGNGDADGPADPQPTGLAAGIAEARRRAAARKGGNR